MHEEIGQHVDTYEQVNPTSDIGCSIELLATQYSLFIYLFIYLFILEIEYRTFHMKGMYSSTKKYSQLPFLFYLESGPQ